MEKGSRSRDSAITLVGSGPGAPDLITVRGLRAIERADAILYDALAAEELLQAAPSGCKVLFVGKRCGHHTYTQEEINELLVHMALQYGHTVRLKGGDPYVFGRGYEEVSFAKTLGIPVQVVPGISSCTSLPALQGVPVTCRGIAESFWTVTGTTTSRLLSADIRLAAQSSATVVVLMGFRKVQLVRQIYRELGRSHFPALAIANGSKANERHVVGTIESLPDLIQEVRLSTPSTLVIGKTVGLHDDFAQLQDSRPAYSVSH